MFSYVYKEENILGFEIAEFCTGWGFARVFAARPRYFDYVTIRLACRTSNFGRVVLIDFVRAIPSMFVSAQEKLRLEIVLGRWPDMVYLPPEGSW